jgi:RNA polymerase sigma-54 factor
MLRQSQSQKLMQRLSPQQIQLMRLLQVPTVSLEERIKEELESNPALEYGEDQPKDAYSLENEGDSDAPENEELESGADGETVDLDDFLRGESSDDGDYYDRESGSGSQDSPGSRYSAQADFHEQMLEQVSLLGLDERTETIARQIVGSLDDDGYLRRETEAMVDDLAFGQNLYTDTAEVEKVVRIIQDLDPAGVGARNLQECLLLQLKRLPQNTSAVKNSTAILTRYFEEFIQKHYDRIQRSLGLDEAAFREAITAILKLDPKPGGAYSVLNQAETYVVPDFFVHTVQGEPVVTLNARNAPDLRVSEGYLDMMKAYDRGDKRNRAQKEAVTFIKQKLDAAKWFIDAIKQRQNTLLSTMNAIVTYQREFFLTGDESAIRPMVLRDIAAITKLDVSTVSRVANSKYVQTEYGTYKLKFFFSEGHQLESGEEVSTRELRNILQQAISAEDKRSPLSDEKLTELLAAKGYNLARRTVAKYREQLNIPVARLRRTI